MMALQQKMLLGLGIVLTLFVLGAAGFYYRTFVFEIFGGGTRLSLRENTHYISAREAQDTGDFEKAKSEYGLVLKTHLEPDQEGLILYRLAVIQSSEDPAGAIEALKKIVANQKYPNIIKAYSVRGMSFVYKRSPQGGLADTIFSGEPYTNFYAEKNIDEANIELLEYSHSFYPLAVTEATLAREYAKQLYREITANPADKKKIMTVLMPLIQAKLALTAQLLEQWNDEEGNESDAYAIRANTYALVERTTGVVLGDYKADHEHAFQILKDNGIQDNGFMRWRYALDLVLGGGAKEAAKIHEVLGPVTSSVADDSLYREVKEFFRLERGTITNTSISDSADVMIMLAKIDPAFKDLLLSLGWVESDFK